MAAYNTGALNVDRAISRAGEANYWKIYPYIAQETRNYVPNILAVIMIAKNPEKYGFHGIRPEAPMSFEIVRCIRDQSSSDCRCNRYQRRLFAVAESGITT